MPTVLQIGRYRLHFFSGDRQEPPHIHVKAGGEQAKFWLNPVSLCISYGFSARELNQIERIINEHHAELLEAWNEHFG
jgi:hypothetical protein